MTLRAAGLTLALPLVFAAVATRIGAQQFFPGQHTTTAGTGNTGGPKDLCVADVNNDGRPDLACANYSGGKASIFLGDGLGGVSMAIPVSMGTGLGLGIAAGDLDNNGSLDLVQTSNVPSAIRVSMNVGSGIFVNSVPYATGSGPVGLAVADLDLDGILDVATANAGSATISLLTGIGAGAFAPAVSLQAQAKPVAVLAADVNGDSLPDLTVVNELAGSVSVLLGQVGGFASAAHVAAGSDPVDVARLDFDGDSIWDAAVLNSAPGTLTLLAGSGSGGLVIAATLPAGALPTSISTGDMNADGAMDILLTRPGTGEIGLLTANGAGGFAPVADAFAATDCVAGATADFNLDSILDFATCNYSQNSVTLFSGNGAGAVITASSFGPPISTRAITIADLDRDGRADLAVAQEGSPDISVASGSGSGSFGPPTAIPAGTNPLALSTIDVNGDGILDIAAITPPLGITILTAQSSGGFGPPATLATSGDAVQLLVLDQDRNGIVDLVAAHAGGLDQFLGTGGGTFGAATTFSFASNLAMATTVDAYGDGTLDVAFVEGGLPSSSIFMVLTTPGISFGPPIFLDSIVDPRAIAAGDLDSDGLEDLTLCAGQSGGLLAVKLANGSGFSSLQFYLTDPNPRSVAIVDVNQDGRTDLATATQRPAPSLPAGTLSIARNTGSGGFFNLLTFGVARDPVQAVTSDLDSDGRVDFGVAHRAPTVQHQVTILTNVNPATTALTHLGTGTAGCFGRLGLFVNSTPALGNPGFVFTCTNAPRNGLGLLLVGSASDAVGSQILGVGAVLHIDILASNELLGFDMISDAGGTAPMAPPVVIPIVAALVGSVYFGQAFFVEDAALGAACGPSNFDLVSSEALGIVVQW